MDISCNIIKDLLPLYAEDMASEDTRKMVDEHLCGCDGCTRELAAIKKAPKVPVETDVKSLKRVGDSIKRRRIVTAFTAIMTVLAIGATVITYLFTPYYLTAEEAIEGVELREDGGFAIDYARGMNGHAGYGHLDEFNWGDLCHTTRYDWYKGKLWDAELEGMTEEELKAYIMEWFDIDECTQRDWDRFFNIYVDHGTVRTESGEIIPAEMADRYMNENLEWTWNPSEENHWYIDPDTGEADVLLWDAGQDYPDSILTETTNIYAVVFYGCVILVAVLFAASRKMNGIARELAISSAIVGCSIACSTLLVTGGHLVTVLLYNWKEMIIFESIFVSLAALLWHQLYRYRKQDKAI